MSKYRLFGRLPAHRRFAKPVTVTIERDTDGWYTVWDDFRGHSIGMGYGPTKGEALADYKRALVSDFLFLSKHASLFEPIQQELEWMRQVITWR